MRKKPEVASGLLQIFLRAVENTLRQRSPGAPPNARFELDAPDDAVWNNKEQWEFP